MGHQFCPARHHCHRPSAASSSPHRHPLRGKHMNKHPKHAIALMKHRKHYDHLKLRKKGLHKFHKLRGEHHPAAAGRSFPFYQRGHHSRYCCLHSAEAAAGPPCCPGQNILLGFDELCVRSPAHGRRSRIHSRRCGSRARNEAARPGQPTAPPEPAAAPLQPAETDREGARVVGPPVADTAPADEGQSKKDQAGPSNA